jgi:uncharacterized FlgJ-related protein
MRETALALIILVTLTACSKIDSPGESSAAVGKSAPAEERFEYTEWGEVADLFDSLNYTPASWAEGNREVPRVFLSTVPERWRAKTSLEITVQDKKRVFFRMVAPLVLYSNELVADERAWLEARRSKIEDGSIDGAERDQAVAIALRYGTIQEGQGLDAIDVNELMKRVDVVPLSLALAQAAEESGWGTSRFANEGNALFGQWTFDGTGIKPEQQRAGMGNYGIKAFESPLESVRAYVHNLNTNRAYADLRNARAAVRAAGGELSGYELAGSLTKYSERGSAYVESLRGLMTTNRLREADQAYLAKGSSILLVPAWEE